MALIIDIADAVATELNAAPAGTFDPAFTAVRRVLPEFELSDLAELKVSVVNAPRLAKRRGRSASSTARSTSACRRSWARTWTPKRRRCAA